MLSNTDYEALEDLLCAEIKKIVKKGEIKDSTEVKGVKDALEAMKLIHYLKGGVEDESLGYYPMHHGRIDFNGTYGRRNMRTGRYMSDGMPDTTYGHSIKDRMVAALEPLYDKAESGYEHTMIQKAINSVQSIN